MPPAPCLIFDLDGTLADTSPDLLGATNAVLAARGRPQLDLDHLRHMVGFGAVALITQAMEASGAPVTEGEMPPLIEIFLEIRGQRKLGMLSAAQRDNLVVKVFFTVKDLT